MSRSRLTDAERGAITDALVGVANDPVAREPLGRALVERFVTVDAGGYDDIRQMLSRVRRAGLLEPTWHDRWQAIAEAGLRPDATVVAWG